MGPYVMAALTNVSEVDLAPGDVPREVSDADDSIVLLRSELGYLQPDNMHVSAAVPRPADLERALFRLLQTAG